MKWAEPVKAEITGQCDAVAAIGRIINGICEQGKGGAGVAVYAETGSGKVEVGRFDGDGLEPVVVSELRPWTPHEYGGLPMLLWCPECGERHVDVGEFQTKEHHTHACQSCGHCWRPAVEPTTGVQFLPGFKNK